VAQRAIAARLTDESAARPSRAALRQNEASKFVGD
jgi:hypothetical protein